MLQAGSVRPNRNEAFVHEFMLRRLQDSGLAAAVFGMAFLAFGRRPIC
jgi:hypothetical protein